MVEVIVEIKNLIKRYGDKLAVDNMSLSIRKREILGLLGPNGAGKTTLINSIIGITEIQSDEVFIFGKSMKKHYMEEVETLCSRVVIMDNGRFITEGTKEELAEYVREEQIIDISLSNPGYTITEAVKDIYGVSECTLSGNMMTVVLDKSSDVSKVINTITDKGGIITKINMEEATLEDVFLTLTGKTLRD